MSYSIEQHETRERTWIVRNGSRHEAVVTPTVDGRWEVQYTDWIFFAHCPSWTVDRLEDAVKGLRDAQRKASDGYAAAEAERRRWVAALSVGTPVFIVRVWPRGVIAGTIESPWASAPGKPDSWLVRESDGGESVFRMAEGERYGNRRGNCYGTERLQRDPPIYPYWMDL